MKNRGIIAWLLFAIAVLSAVHISLTHYGGEKVRAVRRVALLDRASDYVRMELVRKGSPIVVLVRQGREWCLTEPYASKVEESTVYRMLDMLVESPISDEMSDSELLKLGRSRADFELEEPNLAIIAENAKGVRDRIALGSMTPMKDGVYAAIDGVDAVFTVSTNVLPVMSANAAGFRRRSLFEIDDELVSSVEVRRSSAPPVVLSRDGDHWNAGSRLAATTKVKQLIKEAVTASAVDFIWPVGTTNESAVASASLLAAYGLDPDNATTIILRGADGVDRKLTLGGDASDSLVYALDQSGSAIVTIPAQLKTHASLDVLAYTDSRLFPFEASTITSFRLIVDGVEYALARGETDSWRLDAPIAAVADADVAKTLLDKVLALVSADLRSTGVQVAVTTNMTMVTVSPQKLFADLRIDDLRLKDILKIEAAGVKRLVSQIGDGVATKPDSIVFVGERNAWNVESSSRNGAVSVAGVKRLLTAINPLKAVRIEKLNVSAADLAVYGLDKPFLSVAIDLASENAVRRNILIGNRTAGGRFATVGSAEAVFVLDDATVTALTSPLVEE